MSLMDNPKAQALLNDATVSAETVRDCTDRLTGYLQRYLPKFYRTEQRENATLVIRGLLSGLERKTCEPIAIEAGLPRKPIQFFVGAGKWFRQGRIPTIMCRAAGTSALFMAPPTTALRRLEPAFLTGLFIVVARRQALECGQGSLRSRSRSCCCHVDH